MQVAHTPGEPWLFLLQEKPEDPKIQPHAGIKMAQVLGSLVYISGCILNLVDFILTHLEIY